MSQVDCLDQHENYQERDQLHPENEDGVNKHENTSSSSHLKMPSFVYSDRLLQHSHWKFKSKILRTVKFFIKSKKYDHLSIAVCKIIAKVASNGINTVIPSSAVSSSSKPGVISLKMGTYGGNKS